MIDKAAVREVLQDLLAGRRFSPGPLGIEQATNAVLRLDRPALSLAEAALVIGCPYCGRTPGNPCQNTSGVHPSRLWAALPVQAAT